MFVLVVVGTLLASRIWPGSDDEGNRVDSTGTNQKRVGKNNKSGYVIQIINFDFSMNLNE